MSNYILVPCIEWNGEIEELKVSSLTYPHQRQTVKEFGLEAAVDTDLFEPVEIAYGIDAERIASVTVFVDQSFMKDLRGVGRVTFIQSIAKDKAPWIFSYATRNVK